MSDSNYLNLLLAVITYEQNISMVRTLLAQAQSSVLLYVAPARRAAARDRLAEGLQRLLHDASPGSDRQLQFLRVFSGVTRRPEHLDFLRELLEGRTSLSGLQVDTDLRWHLLHRLVAAGTLGDGQIETELAHDNTALGQQAAASARAARPTAAAKAEAWTAVVERDGLPNAIQTAIIGGFAHPDQRELLEPYVERYFAMLEQVWASRTNETAQNLVVGLYPTVLADARLLEATDAWLTAAADAPAALRRLVSESRDGVARALRAQARDAAPA